MAKMNRRRAAIVRSPATTSGERYMLKTDTENEQTATPTPAESTGNDAVAMILKQAGKSADEIAALPVLARGSAMRFLVTRLYDWLNTPPGAMVKPKDPGEYIRKLRFHRQIASATEYGLEQTR